MAAGSLAVGGIWLAREGVLIYISVMKTKCSSAAFYSDIRIIHSSWSTSEYVFYVMQRAESCGARRTAILFVSLERFALTFTTRCLVPPVVPYCVAVGHAFGL